MPSPSQYQDITKMSQFQDKKSASLKSHIQGGKNNTNSNILILYIYLFIFIGKGMIKGFGIGNGPRHDFTKESRKIPGPGDY